jgi:tRNA A-37 threonylcarbamoyl transferase component Bud32
MDDHQLVHLAIDYGFISRDQVAEAEREVGELRSRGVDRSMLFVLGDLGFLSDEQLRILRRNTSSSNVRALVIEGYTLQGRVGSGGMGEVFRGEREDGQAVAVKLLPQKMLDIEEYIGRFRRESRILQKLEHPNITGFLGSGVVEGRPYFLMELVAGQSLKQRLERHGALGVHDTLVMMRQMASALQFAWQFGVVHRDVKPSNIILGAPRRGMNEAFCCKLCDFGLAKSRMRDEDESGSLTKSGMAVGTPHYMSPEVATGSDIVEPCIDIYSLGATAYHSITGNTLYTGKSSAVIMYKQATARIDARDLAPDRVPPSIRRLLADMLAKDRSQRLADWETVLQRIDDLMMSGINQEVGAISVSRGQAVVKPWAFWQMAFSLVTLVLVIAGITLLLFQAGVERVEIITQPETFNLKLQEAEGRLRVGEQVMLVLDPGVYVGPWFFGRAHSDLQLRAAGPGVVLRGTAGLDETLCYLDAGCTGLVLHGLRMEQAAKTVIQVNEGSELRATGLRIHHAGDAALVVDSATAELRGCEIDKVRRGIRAWRGSHVLMTDTVLHAQESLLESDQSQIELDRCRLQLLPDEQTVEGRAVANGVRVVGGMLRLRDVAVRAPGALVGCSLERVNQIYIDNVFIEGGETGVRAFNAAAQQVQHLGIRAGKVGLHWSGPWDVVWRWNELAVQAPEPLRGQHISGLPVNGAGPDADRLSLLPSLVIVP